MQSQLEALHASILADTTLGHAEKERRLSTLRDVKTRVQHNGEHTTSPHPNRASQFMPFAALKGYHELAYERERVTEPKRALTEEHAFELSRTIAHLSKGTMISVEHYEHDHYTHSCGVLTEINEAFMTLRISEKTIAFNNIASIDILNDNTASQ